jgi:hypothetical protein
MSPGDVGQIIDMDGAPEAEPGHDRRGALVLAFAMCVAIGGAAVGRDGPAATAPLEPPRTLLVSGETSGVVLFAFPDRLANEPLPNWVFLPVQVRGTEGLAVNLAEPPPREGVVWIAGDSPMVTGEHAKWVVFWTEAGTAYSLSSDGRDLPDLLRVAGSLR